MPITVSSTTGDGQKVTLIDTDVTLPDSGTSVSVVGSVQTPGQSAVAITGSPVASPGVPGSGTNYWIIQVNTATGAASVKSSTSAMPTADPGNVVVFQQQIAAGASSDPVLDGGDATPDSW
ncbi:MAG TPA: hypothetical protein VFE42_20695 [Chloroflexota bacterium]|nr:hypothetical protein [Chloroflexota bacterium]HZS89897.1 hypothetical protein [Chloroflexota bacterium]